MGKSRFLTHGVSNTALKPCITGWLGFNGTHSTIRLYRAIEELTFIRNFISDR